MSNTVLPQLTVFVRWSALGIGSSRGQLQHSLLVQDVEAAVYIGKAQRTQDRSSLLQCTASIWPAACCAVRLSNIPVTLAKKTHWRSAPIKTSLVQSQQHFISLSYFPLQSDNEAKCKCRGSHNQRKYHIKTIIPHSNALLSNQDTQ